MTALAERPGPRPADLRLTLTGLKLAIGNRLDGHGYSLVFEPGQARALAWDLLRNADRVERQAQPVLDELAGLVTREDDAEIQEIISSEELGRDLSDGSDWPGIADPEDLLRDA